MTSIDDWLNTGTNDPNHDIRNALTANNYDLTRDMASMAVARTTVETQLNDANVPGNLIVNFLDDARIREQETKGSVVRSAYLFGVLLCKDKMYFSFAVLVFSFFCLFCFCFQAVLFVCCWFVCLLVY